MYYNDCHINKASEIVCFLNSSINHNIEYEMIDNLKILSCTIILNITNKIKISCVYRCHDLDKKSFLQNCKTYLGLNKNVRNHFIAREHVLNLL